MVESNIFSVKREVIKDFLYSIYLGLKNNAISIETVKSLKKYNINPILCVRFFINYHDHLIIFLNLL